MSVIQTIRQKYLGLMIGLIVVALLGFLFMSDFKSQGSIFGNKDRSFGSVNGQDVSLQEYNDLEKRYTDNARQKNPKMTEAETEEIKGQAWDDLVNQKLLESEYEKLGINVSDKELQQMLTSQFADPMIQQNFRDPATGGFDPNKVKQYLDNLRSSKDTAQHKQWNEFEKGLIKQRMAQKYTGLVSLGTYIPKGFLEAKLAERNTVSSVDFVKVPYASIDDKKVTVSDDDIKAFMQKYSTAFTLQEPMRKIEYVSFDVIPTPADTQLSLGVINANAAEFASTTNMEEFIGKNSDQTYNTDYYSRGRGETALMDTLIGKPVGSVSGPYFDEGSYKLFKIMDKKEIPDSVKVSHILIAVSKTMSEDDAEKKVDSLLKTVQGGGDIAQLASQLSDDGGSKTKGGDLGYIPRGAIGKEFSDAAFFGSKGEVKKVKSNYGWHVIKITDQKDFKTSVKVASFAKNLKASEGTTNAAYTKASQFINGVSDKASFDAAVKKTGATKRIAEGLQNTQSMVQGLGVARDIVRWAYDKDSKVGSVSDIKTVKDGLIDKYVIANLAEIAEPGLAPVSLVRDRLEGEIRKNKKAKMIADQYKSASSLQDIATKSATTVLSADTILLAGSMNPVLGNEPRVIGASFNKEYQSKISAGIQGNDGVFFIKVKNITPSGVAPNAMEIDRERQMMTMQQAQSIGRSIPMILKKKGKVKDNRGNFM